MAQLALLALWGAVAQAAGLGQLRVQSRIGQPLAAEIELINVGREELSGLKVGLASVAAYREAGLTFDPALNSLRLSLERRANGTPYIRASGTRRVAEPYIDLLIDLATPDGGIQRAYTVLLDLPTASETVAAAPAAAPPVSTTPVDATPREPRPAPARKPVATNTAAASPATTAAAPVTRSPTVAGGVAAAPPREPAPVQKPTLEQPKPVPTPVTPPPAEMAKAEPPAPVAKAPAPAASAQPAETPPATPLATPPSPPPAPAAKKAPAPPPQKTQQPATTASATSYTTLIGGIALALLAVIGGWWALAASRRRREAEEFIALEPGINTAASPAVSSVSAAPQTVPQTTPRAAAPAVVTVSNVTDMVDPIDEARVYLEHGQDEPAEQLLRESLSQQPGREDMQMLLLEILGKRGDKDGFNQLAGRLHKQTGGAGEQWKRVMAMGYALDPAYPLYSPTAGATPAPGAEPMDIDIDLGAMPASGGPATGTATATDIDLGAPATGNSNPVTDIFLDDGSAGKEIEKTLMLQRTGLMPADTPTTTPLDIQFDLPPAESLTTQAATDTKDANNDGGLDFSIDFPTITPPPAIETPAVKPAAAPAKPRINPELLEALLHKIDLARAYREMGDKEAALEELRDVLRDGDDALQAEARELIELLDTPPAA